MSTDPNEYWRPVHEVMVEEGRRAVDLQCQALEDLRGRATRLLGIAGAIAALFIGLNPSGDGVGRWLGIAGFVVVTASVLYVVQSRQFYAAMNVRLIDLWLAAPPDNVEHVLNSLAKGHWDNRLMNKKILERLHWAFFVATVGLAIETGGFLLDYLF